MNNSQPPEDPGGFDLQFTTEENQIGFLQTIQALAGYEDYCRRLHHIRLIAHGVTRPAIVVASAAIAIAALAKDNSTIELSAGVGLCNLLAAILAVSCEVGGQVGLRNITLAELEQLRRSFRRRLRRLKSGRFSAKTGLTDCDAVLARLAEIAKSKAFARATLPAMPTLAQNLPGWLTNSEVILLGPVIERHLPKLAKPILKVEESDQQPPHDNAG